MLIDEKGGLPTVTIADAYQSNGVIHVVDSVLLPYELGCSLARLPPPEPRQGRNPIFSEAALLPGYVPRSLFVHEMFAMGWDTLKPGARAKIRATLCSEGLARLRVFFRKTLSVRILSGTPTLMWL
jgi:hypothetical protein